MNKRENHANLPFKSDNALYQEVVDAIVREAEKNSLVTAVYLMGGEWFPGISDLDLIVVYENYSNPLKNPEQIHPLAGKIFTHRYIAFHKDDFENFFYFYMPETTTVKFLYGRQFDLAKPSDKHKKLDVDILKLVNLADYVLNKLVFLWLKFRKKTKSLDVRQRLGELSSLRYDFILLQSISGRKFGESFVGRVDDLKDNWFDRDEESNIAKLKACSDQAIGLISDFLEEMEKTVHELPIVLPEGKLVFRNRKLSIKFAGGPIAGKGRSVNILGKDLSWRDFRLPKSLALPLIVLSNGQGVLSGLIRESFEMDSNSIDFGEAVFKQAEAKNEMFKRFVESQGFYRMPFLYGFGLFDWRFPRISCLIANLQNYVRLGR